MNLVKRFCMMTLLVCVASARGAEDNSAFATARRQRRAFSDKLMETILAAGDGEGTSDVLYALAGLYTDKDQAGANDRLCKGWKQATGPEGKMTAEGVAGVKWQMRTWLRIYYLFNDKSEFFPGRLEKDVQAMMEEMFFFYGCGKSKLTDADLKNIWAFPSSENHSMMDWSNAYLALQAVQNLEGYKKRKLPDGNVPSVHVKAWEAYYGLYPLTRAQNGLYLEMSPIYGKWFFGELVNMYEFAESKRVREGMEKLLHLTWADWSIDQVNGVRGGGKTRAYQGLYSQKGDNDSWDSMGRMLTGMQGAYGASAASQSHLILATSNYELPDIVLDLALNRDGVEPFVYKSTRPAKITADSKAGPGYGRWLDPKGGGVLRYTYWTPECVLGSWMLDTRIEVTAGAKQNRWQGIVFANHRSAQVFPQSVGEAQGGKTTFNQHIAVQHRNAMVVMRHPQAEGTGPLRVFFPRALYERVVEQNGWVILQEGDAWLGVRVLSTLADPNQKNYEFRERVNKETKKASHQDTDCFWLWPRKENTPIAFVVSRKAFHKTTGEFLGYLATHEFSVAGGTVDYVFTDDLGKKVSMELSPKMPVPLVNGEKVDTRPVKVFDSPFLNSDHGSGVVTIEKGTRKLVLDFNR